jgi:hypothetical protein
MMPGGSLEILLLYVKVIATPSYVISLAPTEMIARVKIPSTAARF